LNRERQRGRESNSLRSKRRSVSLFGRKQNFQFRNLNILRNELKTLHSIRRRSDGDGSYNNNIIVSFPQKLPRLNLLSSFAASFRFSHIPAFLFLPFSSLPPLLLLLLCINPDLPIPSSTNRHSLLPTILNPQNTPLSNPQLLHYFPLYTKTPSSHTPISLFFPHSLREEEEKEEETYGFSIPISNHSILISSQHKLFVPPRKTTLDPIILIRMSSVRLKYGSI